MCVRWILCQHCSLTVTHHIIKCPSSTTFFALYAFKYIIIILLNHHHCHSVQRTIMFAITDTKQLCSNFHLLFIFIILGRVSILNAATARPYRAEQSYSNKGTKKSKSTLSSSSSSRRLRSRNSVIDDWLGEEDGSDTYADLEDFLVE